MGKTIITIMELSFLKIIKNFKKSIDISICIYYNIGVIKKEQGKMRKARISDNERKLKAIREKMNRQDYNLSIKELEELKTAINGECVRLSLEIDVYIKVLKDLIRIRL